MMTYRAALLPFLLVATQGLESARAATRVLSVVRGVGAGSDRAAAFVSHSLSSIMAQDSRYVQTDVDKALGSSDAENALRNFASAQELTDKGRQAYESLDLDAALQLLNNALAKYQKNIDHLSDIDKYAELLMVLGATHILRGEDKPGAKRLAQALEVKPTTEPDPHVFNPTMRKVFDDVAIEVNQRQRGVLSINSNPSYGEVFVDGVFRGITPLNLSDVVEGQHVVRVVKQGYESNGKLVNVLGKTDTPFTANLKALPNYEQYEKHLSAAVKGVAKDPHQINEGLEQLGALTNADHIVLAQVRLNGERVQVDVSVYDLNESERIASGTEVFSYGTEPSVYDREMGLLHRRALGEFKPVERGKRGDGATVKTKRRKCSAIWCHSGLNWGLAAGGAVLAAGGGAFWFLAKNSNDEFRTARQVSREAAQLKDEGQRQALIGDILVPIGGAAMATGITFIIIKAIKAEPPPPTASTDTATEREFVWSLAPLSSGGAFFSTAMSF